MITEMMAQPISRDALDQMIFEKRAEWMQYCAKHPIVSPFKVYLTPEAIPWTVITPKYWNDIVCSICCEIIQFCKHRPNRQRTAEEWQQWYKDRAAEKKLEEVVTANEEGEEVIVKVKRENRPRTTVAVTEEIIQQAIRLIEDEGLGMVAAANQLRVNPAILSPKLKEKGIEIKKGRRKGTAPLAGEKSFGRQKTTIDLTDAILQQAKELVEGGMAMTVAAKTLNVSAAALSPALKALGVAIQKGRKKGSPAPAAFGRKRTTNELSEAIIKKAMKAVQGGFGVVATAKELNVNAGELSKKLKELGVEIKKGKRAKQ